MRIAVFSTKRYDQRFLAEANRSRGHELVFLEPRLTYETARLAEQCEAVCVFVNDEVGKPVLEVLRENGTRIVALRSAGFNHVDLEAAAQLGIQVVRVPAYSPFAVAEHTMGLVLALNRRIHRAYNRVREGNFALQGLMGFDLHGRTVGLIGTGRIGAVMARIVHGFGCKLLAYDPYPNEEVEQLATYVTLPELLKQSDIVSLHCPLTPETYHLIDAEALKQLKPGAMLVNTSRGALVHAEAAIEALKDGQLGGMALDVYEEEADLFFEDLSDRVIKDDVFARLLTFPNVIVTGHQAFFTEDALRNIAEVTLSNIDECIDSGDCANAVTTDFVRPSPEAGNG